MFLQTFMAFIRLLRDSLGDLLLYGQVQLACDAVCVGRHAGLACLRIVDIHAKCHKRTRGSRENCNTSTVAEWAHHAEQVHGVGPGNSAWAALVHKSSASTKKVESAKPPNATPSTLNRLHPPPKSIVKPLGRSQPDMFGSQSQAKGQQALKFAPEN